MAKSKWKNMKKCWCLKKFLPETPNQVHCCLRHGRIWTRAHEGEWGADLIKNDPAYALIWYDYVR